MQNKDLGKDYLTRSQKRIKALQTLFDEHAWADVVRESQEVVELCLKGLLRFHFIEVPRIHDVSGILETEVERFPKNIQKQVPKLIQISKSLRRDSELAFYGSEDLTPSEFYKEPDALEAKKQAEWVVSFLYKELMP